MYHWILIQFQHQKAANKRYTSDAPPVKLIAAKRNLKEHLMTARRYKFTILALVLALIAAIVIPLVRGNELPRLSLAADNQLTIGCPTKLTVELQDQHATLRC